MLCFHSRTCFVRCALNSPRWSRRCRSGMRWLHQHCQTRTSTQQLPSRSRTGPNPARRPSCHCHRQTVLTFACRKHSTNALPARYRERDWDLRAAVPRGDGCADRAALHPVPPRCPKQQNRTALLLCTRTDLSMHRMPTERSIGM